MLRKVLVDYGVNKTVLQKVKKRKENEEIEEKSGYHCDIDYRVAVHGKVRYCVLHWTTINMKLYVMYAPNQRQILQYNLSLCPKDTL